MLITLPMPYLHSLILGTASLTTVTTTDNRGLREEFRSWLESLDVQPFDTVSSPALKRSQNGGTQEVSCSLKTEEEREWMNADEAASYLRISKGALRNLTSNGHIPFCKLGRRVRYLRSELQALLLANHRGGV
jgi:excisionase family DNA binding protein